MLLIIFLAPVPKTFSDQTPNLYQVTYSAKYNGMAVKAHRQLKATEHGYRIISTVKGMLGGMTEQEDFNIDDQGHIHTDHYLAEKSFFGIESKEELVIDQAANKAVYTRKKKRKEIHLSDDLLGPVSYQLQLRNDLKAAMAASTNSAVPEQALSDQHPLYKVMSRGRIKDYQFKTLGEEAIKTRVGEIATIKVRRVRKGGKRQTTFWMAPAWDFLIVKIKQREKGGEDYEMLLETASINGQLVSFPK